MVFSYENSTQFVEDTQQYSVMSYFGARHTAPDAPKVYPPTLMLYDIYALQQMYGVNHNTRAGDTTYGFNATEGGAYDFTVNTKPLMCIWDGGGNDTLDLSGFNKDQRITLHDEVFSDVGGWAGNLSIAVGAVIENAIGGTANDAITGNEADNILKGGKGGDTLAGETGDDRLVGGNGADSFVFAAGLGSDVIQGFNLTRDHLVPDAAIWGGDAKTAAEVIADYATIIGGKLVLDFGLSEIVLAGLTCADGLESRILFA